MASDAGESRAASTFRWSWPAAVLLGAAVVAAAVVLGYPRRPKPRPVRLPPQMTSPIGMGTPFVWPGIDRPPVKPAAEVNLPDDAPVIGVTVDGRHRAYLLAAMVGMSRHVVNDLIGDVPVTATFCNMADCARTVTAESRGEPLDVSTGGWLGELLIRTNGWFYTQAGHRPTAANAPPFPHQDLPHERTTWKKWKDAHPDTDVYVGPDPDHPPPGLKPDSTTPPGGA